MGKLSSLISPPVRLDLTTLAASVLEYKDLPLVIELEFSEKLKKGIACMILAEHQAVATISPEGQVNSYVIAK